VEWIRKAAMQQDADAQVTLGVMRANGAGVPQDYARAAAWFRTAAAQGDPDAQFDLGLLYLRGDGVPRDYVQAYAWFDAAAAQGNLKAIEFHKELAARLAPPDLSRAQDLSSRYISDYAPAPSPR